MHIILIFISLSSLSLAELAQLIRPGLMDLDPSMDLDPLALASATSSTTNLKLLRLLQKQHEEQEIRCLQ